MMLGNELSSLFVLSDVTNKRCSSYDPTGGNHDWMDFDPFETKTIATIKGSGVVRHIWCTYSAQDPVSGEERLDARSQIWLRAYWDDETQPSIVAPLGDFFCMGFGLSKKFHNAAFSCSPQNGRGMSCYFPMPFRTGAWFEIENRCEAHLNFYYHIDYEEYPTDRLPDHTGYFHAQYRHVLRTTPTAPICPGRLKTELANSPDHPSWYPKAWMAENKSGAENYVILEATGSGKYVGCNLNIYVHERQTSDWYGEGDDMIFLDGDVVPTIHGTGTEDYFNTAFCPTQEFESLYHGITRYSGDVAGFPYGGANCMYRLHIPDPIHFKRSIQVTIEHGHNNDQANEYTSTAYWYQTEPHQPF